MWSQHLKQFEQILQKGGRTPTTITAYKSDFRQFAEYCKGKKVDGIEDVDSELVKKYITHLKAKDYSPKTVSRKLNTIRTFYKEMKAAGKLKANPAAQIHHPRIKGSPPRILNETEYMALKEACRSNMRLFAMVELLLQTGMKIGELCRLKLEDIKKKSNKPKEIFIKKYHKIPGRWVPLNTKASQALQEYLKTRPKTKSEYVFVSSTGRPVRIRNLRSYIMRAFERAGIENAKVNDLRNTFIVQQLKKGTNLVVLSQIVGHKRISTTEKYLDLVKKESETTPSLPEL